MTAKTVHRKAHPRRIRKVTLVSSTLAAGAGGREEGGDPPAGACAGKMGGRTGGAGNLSSGAETETHLPGETMASSVPINFPLTSRAFNSA